MNTGDVIKALAGKLGISQAKARLLLKEMLQDWTDRIGRGETVYIAGLGRFQTQTTKLRRNYIPGKQAWCMVPPRRRVSYRAAGPLKQTIRDEVDE